MKSWTVAQMLAEKPCGRYDKARIARLWGKRKSRTLVEILRDRRIPPADRMWPVWRKGALTKAQAKTVLDRIVTRAVTNHALRCGVPAVEAWAHGWLDGTDRSRTNAYAAAYAAAYADYAAYAAAAAACADYDAAYAAAAAANAAAADDVEHRLQIADVLAVIEEGR
jgi:hypothetical protein